MTDHSGMQLGKKAVRHDPRTLKMAKYMNLADLPMPPKTLNWGVNVRLWPMMKNNEIGDCAWASAGHLIQLWTAAKGTMYVPPDDQIVDAYSKATGYNPADPSTDRGTVELDALNYWRNTGIAGHKIGAYMAINLGNDGHVKTAIWMFGGIYIGLDLPVTAQNQDIWDYESKAGNNSNPGSWGGHAVPIIGYSKDTLLCVTWGEVKEMTWDFWDAYADEAYAVLGNDWIAGVRLAPSGFDLATLQADLNALGAE